VDKVSGLEMGSVGRAGRLDAAVGDQEISVGKGCRMS